MTRTWIGLSIITGTFAFAGLANAQGDLRMDLQPSTLCSADEIQRLAKELSLARRSNASDRARALEKSLWMTMPTVPAEGDIASLTGDGVAVAAPSAQLRWGDDIQLYSGALMTHDQYPMALVADTMGTIYVGVNAVFRDTSSRIIVYRSTDNGTSWGTLISFFASSGKPIHSFDMCVTDTAGGKFLLGIAFVVQFSDGYYNGGKLYWASVLSDGSGMRISTIANADSAHLYGNPSICTDGDKFAPSLTYHYVASEVGGMTATTYPWHGLYITHSTNWGKNWVYPDTSITGTLVETPDLIVDYSSMPESLCVAYHHQGTTTHHLSVAHNSIARSSPWETTPLVRPSTMSYPRLAIDPVRGNALLTYGHNGTSIEYMYSSDLFKSYTRDSIAAGPTSEPVSVSWAPLGTGYVWRVAYRSASSGGKVFVKAVYNRCTGFYADAPLTVNQYTPGYGPSIVIGQNRDPGTGAYQTNCVYAGADNQNVYFDAGDVTVDVPQEQMGLPSKCALQQNYPNPFNPTTNIRYSVGVIGLPAGQAGGQWPVTGSHVRIAVYDLLGRELAVLLDGQKPAGTYQVEFDGCRLSSGVYFYRLTAGDYVETKRMMLLR
jgi:hypothetical protein